MPKKGNKGKSPLDPSAKRVTCLPLQSPEDFSWALPRPTWYQSCLIARTCGRWLAGHQTGQRRERKRSQSADGEVQERIVLPSALSSSQAPYRLAFSQAQKLAHSAARPLKIKASALILLRKTEGADAELSRLLRKPRKRRAASFV